MSVTIGIDRYRAWPTLSNAVSDTEGTVDVFRRLGFQPFAQLIDEAATGDAIRRLIADDLTTLSDIARLAVRHVLVILDACHSGIALGSLIKWRNFGIAREASLADLHRRQSRRVIASALGDQRAMDSGPIANHSLFTGCLLEGLTGGLARAGKREATTSELGIYVQHRVAGYPARHRLPISARSSSISVAS